MFRILTRPNYFPDKILTLEILIKILINLTFKRRFSIKSSVSVPGRITVGCKLPESEVGDGQSDYGGLVQLGGDGPGQWQHLGQLVKFIVFFSPARSGRVTGLLLS